MKTIKRHIKKIIALAIPFFGGLYLIPLPAEAIAFLGPGVIAFAAYWLLYVIQYVGTFLFTVAAGISSYFLEYNYYILENNGFILTGWTIVRDVANLGFVIVIVVLAIATILRFEEYSAKKLLPKLIAAAILVNFSLAIAGVFIDFSNVLTRYFFNPVAGAKTSTLMKEISAAFDPQTFLAEPPDPEVFDPEDETAGGVSTGTLNDIAQLVFAVVFIYVAVFVLLAFAFMLLIRYLFLSFLLIIAPVVWLFWVIPALASQFSKWWSTFLKWLFFAPAASFFFYLTLTSLNSLKQGSSKIELEAFGGGFTKTLMLQGGRMALITGIMIGGLVVAEQMGIHGAKGAMGLLNKAKGGIQKWAGQKAGRFAERRTAAVLGSDKGRAVVRRLQTFGKDFKPFGPKFSLSGIAAPVRLIGSGLAAATRATTDKRRAAVRKGLEGTTADERNRMYNTASPEMQTAILEMNAEEGKKVNENVEERQKAKTRADARLANAIQRLAAATDDLEKVKAKDAIKQAENDRDDKQLDLDKANERKRKFDVALSNLPEDTRAALEKEKFDLARVSIPTFGGAYIKKPRRYIATIEDKKLPGGPARREEYKGGEK